MPPDLLPAETLTPVVTPHARDAGTVPTDGLHLPAVLPSPQTSLDFQAPNGLDMVRDRVVADDKGKWDLTVPRLDLWLQDGRLNLPDGYQGDKPASLSFSPWARSQACQRLGIPAGYFARCWPPLQDAQFNHWLWRGARPTSPDPEWADAIDMDGDDQGDADRPREPERWLLRCQGSEARAVLSSRYAPLDNRQVLDALSPLVASRFEVKGLSLTPESFHLRLVDPQLAREVLPDDRLLVGLHIANSEVGARSVTVDALVYRLVCQNGLIRLVNGRSLLRRRHVIWSEDRFTQSLQKAVGEAVTAGAGLLERLAWATRASVPDMDKTLDTLSKQWDLTKATSDAVRQALLATPTPQQETTYGLVNALTFAAQSLSPDDRYDLEAKAGRLLDHGLPRLKPALETTG